MTAIQDTQEVPEATPGDSDASHKTTGSVSRPSGTPGAIPSSPRRIEYIAPLLLLLLAFIFMLPGLPPFKVPLPMDQALVFPPWKAVYPATDPLFPGGDPLFQQIPWRHWAQDEFAAGRFPLWSSGPLGGAPLFAYDSSAVLFPLNLLWVLVPVGVGAGIVMALKLWLAGWGMWVFLRAMRLHWTASLLGAIGFMFCGSMVKWLPWTLTNATLFLPWLCWAVYAWCVEEKRWALPVFAVATAFAVFGGHPENLTIVMGTAGVWALGLIVGSRPGRWLKQIAGLGIACVVGLAVAAVQLLPFLEAIGLSRIISEPGRTSAWAVHQDASTLVEWILPRWWGQIYDGVIDGPISFYDTNYIGIPALLGLIFAAIALLQRKLNLRLVLPWLAAGILAWIITYDDAFGDLVRQLPVLSHSLNVRWVLAVGFAVLVIGAFGWDWFARWVGERWSQDEARRTNDGGAVIRRPSTAILALLGVALLAVGVGVLVQHLAGLFRQPEMDAPPLSHLANASYRFYWAIWAAGVVLGVAGAALLWLSGWLGRLTTSIMCVVLSGLLIADLWMLLFTFTPGSPPSLYYPTTSFISQMRSLLPPTERVVMQGEVMPANSHLVYGIRDWRYQDPMISKRAFRASTLLSPGYEKSIWTRYNMFLTGIRTEVAPLFGIRYLVYPNDINPAYWEPDPARPTLKRLAFTEGLGLWEIEGVPGFAYLSDNVEAVPGELEAEQWIKDLTWDDVRSYPAVVEAPASSVDSIERSAEGESPGSANVLAYTPGQITLQTDARRPALLVVAESYYPGWHATLDGQPVEILRANYISQGVVVPEGKHTVEFRYEPDSFRNGALISLAGLVGLAGLIIWWRRGARRP